MNEIAYFKIHPSIGIARIGNSPTEFFIGPEIPGQKDPPQGGYKDSQGRIKRQAARFRVFAYDKEGKEIGEITTEEAHIQWIVHLANKKAAWHRFQGLDRNAPLRNEKITNRSDLKIDPGQRTINGINQSALFDTGSFMGTTIPLGEIKTDDKGRLLVLGGFGNSHSPTNADLPDTEFANNDEWFDDVSDGPVNAFITLKDSRKSFDAIGSWVICPPPDFAPPITSVITMFDTLRQAAVKRFGLKIPVKPSFTNDIYPILQRAMGMRFVNKLKPMKEGNAAATPKSAMQAPKPPSHSTIPAVISATATHAARKAIFKKLRDPKLPYNVKSKDDSDMPMLWSDYYVNGQNQPLTMIQYNYMKKWMNGNFINDWVGEPQPGTTISPEGLDRAALEACVGGAFYPGIEASWMLRDVYSFIEPYRLDNSVLEAGDVTKQMALPWQADFTDCRQEDPYAWWPSQRPDQVFVEGHTVQLEWTRDLIYSFKDMVHKWHRLGFVVKKGDKYMETERT